MELKVTVDIKSLAYSQVSHNPARGFCEWTLSPNSAQPV